MGYVCGGIGWGCQDNDIEGIQSNNTGVFTLNSVWCGNRNHNIENKRAG